VTTLTGGFTVTAGYPSTVTASQITVKVNGYTAQVTQSPTNPQQGSWAYMGGTQIAPSAGTWTETVTYTGPNGQAPTSGGTVTRQWTVFTVMPFTVPNLPRDGGNNDVVHTASSLRYEAGSPGIPTGLSSATYVDSNGLHEAREIRNGFVISGPDNNFAGITVGIIQTVNENSTLGSIPHTKVGDPSVTGTLAMSFVSPGPPWWDGDMTAPCYYGAEARITVGVDIPSSGNGTNGGNYTLTYGSASAHLRVLDSPFIGLGTVVYNGTTFEWGITGFAGRTIGNSVRYDSFEDMLCASAYEVPNVVVPIYGYFDWNVTFAGTLNLSTMVWSGGSVNSNWTHPTIQPVADQSRGPVDTKVSVTFTVP
jgi:hypothetical protein